MDMDCKISRIIHLEETDSTNAYAHQLLEDDANTPMKSDYAGMDDANTPMNNANVRSEDVNAVELTLVYADAQTAGRGQIGNSWECEAGENVTFSLICHPRFLRPTEQFVLSEAIALAVADSCRAALEGCEMGKEGSDEGKNGYETAKGECGGRKEGRGEMKCGCSAMKEKVTVKWPNDIYYGDRKLSGTLIECYLRGGELADCVIGTGVNVNQMVFRSDAPNPVSLKQISGKTFDREMLLQDICLRFMTLYNRINRGEADEIHTEYLHHLYRGKGVHEYADAEGRFRASILDVERTGRLLLQRTDGTVRRYGFKEVKFVIL